MINYLEPTITDLFGNNITINSLFLIINSNEIHKLLNKIATNKTSSIWDYDRKLIDPLLEQRNLDPNSFITCGHIFYTKEQIPKQIILVNKNICKNAVSLEKKIAYNDGYIYEPIYDDNSYVSIGSYYNIDGNFSNNIFLIPQKFTIKLENSANLQFDNIYLNEFNLFTIDKNALTINRTLLLNKPKSIKLSDSNRKYMTKTGTHVQVNDSTYMQNQNISYNTQGELMIDDKCLTYTNENENNLLFDTCKNDDSQKWIVFQDKINPQINTQKCITSNSITKTITLEKCNSNNDNNEQSWDVENSNKTNNDYTWDKYKGKTVMLVESDNPWFINKDIVASPPNKININKLNILRPQNYADADASKINLDMSKPNLGLGYSYASRQQIEPFTSGNNCDDNANQNNFIIFICFIILFLITFRYWRK